MASVKEDNFLSPYRKLLSDLSFDLSKKDVENLASVDIIPRKKTENIAIGLDLFDVLEQDGRIGPQNLDLLQDMLEIIGRVDLARKIQDFLSTSLNGGTGPLTCDHTWQNDSVPDGIEDDPSLQPQASKQVKASQLVRQSPLNSSDHAGGPTVAFRGGRKAEATPQTGVCLAAVGCTSSDGNRGSLNVNGPSTPGSSGSSSGRIKHVGPEPTRYVNFLAYQGYVVEILGGKHFKTPKGEFVEMKSGTQYKIHVKNTHDYGCNLDVSVDGYDVGGWVVDGGQEFIIERPAYEAKKFTFYRVKTAPEEAGIVPDRAENGVVKCTFTPEVIISASEIEKLRELEEQAKMKFQQEMNRKELELRKTSEIEKLRELEEQAKMKFQQEMNRRLSDFSKARVVEPDPAWRAGGTTLQGYSTQQFVTAEPIKVDPSRKVELVLRLVAREDEDDLVFPKDECKPLSTLFPPPVPE